ncbi:divalent metal cation transporter [bacterium]|nr:MAG: divalent metal cation transporter [bacterium]
MNTQAVFEGGLSAGEVPVPEAPSRGAKSGRERSWLRAFLAFAGPGFLVSVGYMDPGNWATDIAGGARFGYSLIWVILASNLCAIFLQTLCARLGIATGHDLAQACRAYYSKPVSFVLWVLAEVAIIACDLAEVIGSAIAINLLTAGRISLTAGVLITGFDVLILLGALHFGFRKLEAIILTLVTTIAACFALQIFFAKPDWGGVAHGLIPSLPPSPAGTGLEDTALYLALGILGATVMPHNLYLHSSIVGTRRIGKSNDDKADAIKWNTLDTVLSLGAAFFVNAAILVVAAATFHAVGRTDVSDIADAHSLLAPLLGAPVAATAFAVALLASGQSSTITGTLAGQIVMEGFLNIKVPPLLRRVISRGLAIIPALVMIHVSGGKNTTGLLVLSQVVLTMQLPFAIFPLVMFTSDKGKMGEFVSKPLAKWVGYAIASTISGLNVYLLYQTLREVLT